MSTTDKAPQTCFVVMGFGSKTDLATGRVLNLDASYRAMIKPAVEECGLKCIRADEIQHSGVIDVPMYEQLYAADLVIADLSTANPNALYELGVRHALRPRTTIVIAEDKFSYPFDVNHILIRSYKHLCEDIGFSEAERFRGVLKTAIEEFLKQADEHGGRAEQPDSPVYTFLTRLNPPALRAVTQTAARAIELAVDAVSLAAAANLPPSDTNEKALASFIAEGEKAIAETRFADAKLLFGLALEKSRPANNSTETGVIKQAADPYLVHRLTLATYKAKQPNEVTALQEAWNLLSQLKLTETNDPESLGLAGAIEKRLFTLQQGNEHLNRAIRFYERGYYLKNDYYNGINLAFLLDLRATSDADFSVAEKIADHVIAGRVRREVLDLCVKVVERIQKQQAALANLDDKDKEKNALADELYWVYATQAEAYFGLAELERFQAARAAAELIAPAPDWPPMYLATRENASKLSRPAWMLQSTDEQIQKLKTLLEKNAELFQKLA